MTTDWQIYRTRFLVKAHQLTAPHAFVDGLGRQHSGLPGDYLVQSSDGARSILRRHVFEDIYVAMGLAGELPPPAIRPHSDRRSPPRRATA